MNSETNGPGAILLNFCSTFFVWITLHDIQMFATLMATISSIISAFFAARFYYRKTKSTNK